MSGRISRLLLRCRKEQLRAFSNLRSEITSPPISNSDIPRRNRSSLTIETGPRPRPPTLDPPTESRQSTATIQLTDNDKGIAVRPGIKPYEDIPGPPAIPILGSMVNKLPGGMFHKKSMTEIGGLMYEKYGPVVKERHVLGFEVVHLYHPEDIETLFRNDGKHPIRTAFQMLQRYNDKHNNSTQGLLTTHGEKWKRLRSNVQQKMLRPKAVTAYFEDQSLVGDDLLEKIAEQKSKDGVIDDVREFLYRYATECIGVVCFNTRLGALRNTSNNSETSQFIQAVNTVMVASHKEFMKLPLYMWFNTPSFKSMSEAQKVIRRMAEKYCNSAVQKRLENQDDIQGEDGDLVPYLLTKSDLSRQDVYTVISEFIFAGVDTTAHYLAFTLYALAKHPEAQETLQREIDEIVVDGTDVSSTDISRMSYLKAVLKESLRFYPVAPGNCRTTTKEMVLGDYAMPEGTFIAIHGDWICRQEKYFPQADKFLPDRWIRERGWKACHPFANIPFGFGPRSCIGKRFAEQEVSLAVVKILKKYRIEYLNEDMKVEASITFTPVAPMAFRFAERKN